MTLPRTVGSDEAKKGDTVKLRSISAIALAAAAMCVAVADPQAVAAEFCVFRMPQKAVDVRGDTFLGDVTNIRVDGESPPIVYVTFAVDKVYARTEASPLAAGRTIEIYSNPCDGFATLDFDVGDRVLMSTAYLDRGDRPATWNTAMWIVTGEDLRLALPTGDDYLDDDGQVSPRIWTTDDRRIAAADTVREALRLVAPGAPDTSTVAVPVDDPVAGAPPWLALLIASLAASVTFRSRRVGPKA